jgi:hypothetical protein
MYTLLRGVPGARLLRVQLPAFAGALLLAETFYKFQSFTLECLAFLATWFVFDWAAARIAGEGG